MQNNDVLQDDVGRKLNNKSDQWNKINRYAIIIAVVCFLACAIELAVMDFVTVTFTIAFLSIMGSLTVIATAWWIVSDHKLRFWKRQLRNYGDSRSVETEREDETKAGSDE